MHGVVDAAMLTFVHHTCLPCRYLNLPPPEALFADLDSMQSAHSQHWEAESIEPLYRSSNESGLHVYLRQSA